jgi:hypothetical protein
MEPLMKTPASLVPAALPLLVSGHDDRFSRKRFISTLDGIRKVFSNGTITTVVIRKNELAPAGLARCRRVETWLACPCLCQVGGRVSKLR